MLPQDRNFHIKKKFLLLLKTTLNNGFVRTSGAFQALVESKETDPYYVSKKLGFIA